MNYIRDAIDLEIKNYREAIESCERLSDESDCDDDGNPWTTLIECYQEMENTLKKLRELAR